MLSDQPEVAITIFLGYLWVGTLYLEVFKFYNDRMCLHNLYFNLNTDVQLYRVRFKICENIANEFVKHFLVTKMVRNACFWLENIHYASLKVLLNMGTFVPL